MFLAAERSLHIFSVHGAERQELKMVHFCKTRFSLSEPPAFHTDAFRAGKSPEPSPVPLRLSYSSSVLTFCSPHSLYISLPSPSPLSVSPFRHISSSCSWWDLMLSCVKPQISTSSKTGQSQCHPAARPHRLTGCVARRAPLHCTLWVCERWACAFRICRMEGWMQGNRMRETEGTGGQGNQLCFCWVYIINVLLNRTVSTHSISSDHKCKYCLED